MILQKLRGFFLGTLRRQLIVGVAVVHALMMALFIGDLTARNKALLLERQTEQATGPHPCHLIGCLVGCL
ncbi:MAG: hypothetical protein OEL57_01250 [Trichlorobacter sp.]|uniref:hypothetical protein n=1 Tax=Trichlorobacter sp. TaxID=2911007 RepID=UPI002564B869|nr:hypothetical protein [Trichlorobacter sp.]MDK9716518.1 hypothetical protein [Trichlorobacter sp.]